MKISSGAGKETGQADDGPAADDTGVSKGFRKLVKDPFHLAADDGRYRVTALIRRLFLEQGLVHWRRYTIAFILMGVAAGATAISAYLIGTVINEAYVNRNVAGIITLGFITVAVFTTKGVATYGHSVMLSRIGNRIVADNQRAVFAKLLNEGIGFFSDRHSTEFIMRLSQGAAAATQVINLLITSVGRDLFTLIGLVTVMVIQDPLMSFVSFVVAPPAIFILRKMIRRVYSIARNQFHGNTQVIETLQETLHGIRIVKAFTLEDIMRERFARNVAAVEHEANKMARVSSRASPLMETLGGCAVAIAITYGGYRVIETGATPGQFFSFIAAFLLAYEPAKRLPPQYRAQQCVGRGAHPVRGARLTTQRTRRRRQAGLADQDTADRIRQRGLRLSKRRVGAARHVVHGRAGQAHRAGRSLRRRQVDRVQSDFAFLRARAWSRRHRRARHLQIFASLAASPDRLCRPGCVPVPRNNPREH